MKDAILAVHACGFENNHEICSEFKMRLMVASERIRFDGYKAVMISGGVPYKLCSVLLAHKGGEFLREETNRNPWILCATDCFNSSTDVQNFINLALENKFAKITAISSYWHLWALKPIYSYWNKKAKNQLEIEFVGLNTGMTGNKTICFYFVYGFLARASLALGFFKIFDGILNSIHSKRINGYPVSGCG